MSRWRCVLTHGGANLLAGAAGNMLRITRAECGSGNVATDELEKQTAVTGKEKEMEIVQLSSKGNVSSLRLQLANEGITQGFELRQIGIYGKLNQEADDVLYMLLQIDSEFEGDFVPSSAQSPNYVYECLVNLILGGAENVEANIELAAFSTVGHTHEVTEVIGSLAADDVVDSLDNASSDKPLSANMGRVLDLYKVDSGAMAAALSLKASNADLNNHKNNKSNPHGVTAAGLGAVPTSRTINNKALSGNISLNAADVGAAQASHTHTAAQVSGVIPYQYIDVPSGDSLDFNVAPCSNQGDYSFYAIREVQNAPEGFSVGSSQAAFLSVRQLTASGSIMQTLYSRNDRRGWWRVKESNGTYWSASDKIWHEFPKGG